jgi:hypothetical protein
MDKLLEMSVLKRTAILWVTVFILTFMVFQVAVISHPDAWMIDVDRNPETGWSVFLFVIFFNLLLISLIVFGNIFVRFGSVTPGLAILLIQAVNIGWIAGTNAFLEPFTSVASANMAFLRIGLWEITAYVLFCSATYDKSLYISETFPAKKWKETRTLNELHFSKADKIILLLGSISLLSAATVEAFIG